MVVELLEAEGALVSVEDRVIPTPYGDRSGVVIEPWLTDQWYVDAAKLAEPVLEATRKGDIRIVPETWKKTWFNWLENIQPWCVSRQMWWGHRIQLGTGHRLVKMATQLDPRQIQTTSFSLPRTEDTKAAEAYGRDPNNIKLFDSSSSNQLELARYGRRQF